MFNNAGTTLQQPLVALAGCGAVEVKITRTELEESAIRIIHHFHDNRVQWKVQCHPYDGIALREAFVGDDETQGVRTGHGLGATRRLFRICRRLLCRWLVQTAERIFHKQPNKSATNDRTKSQQTTEKASKDLYNSIIISIFAAKLSNKRKMTICINQE